MIAIIPSSLHSLSLVVLVFGVTTFALGEIGDRFLEKLVGRASQLTQGTYSGEGELLSSLRQKIWLPRVNYEVGGKPFSAQAQFAEGIDENTPAGTKVEVYYDPNEPHFVYVVASSKKSSRFLTTWMTRIGVALVTLALVMEIVVFAVR